MAADATVSVPFVGCPADGQMGPVDPPKGNPVSVPVVAPEIAKQLAYYKGENGPGVFAPVGWRCQTWYGSNGAFIVVTPGKPSRPVRGPGVELVNRDGGTSGRFEVAAVSARFFPDVARDFIQQVRAEKLMPEETFDPRPYPADTVTRLTSRMMEFSTPAHKEGFGTEGFVKSGQRVSGIVTLSAPEDELNTSVLRVRLPAKQSALSTALVQIGASCLANGNTC